MLEVRVQNDRICVGRYFSISFQRTLCIPDDGLTYPLPPGLGEFPILRVSDYLDRCPLSWREQGGVFIPIYLDLGGNRLPFVSLANRGGGHSGEDRSRIGDPRHQPKGRLMRLPSGIPHHGSLISQ